MVPSQRPVRRFAARWFLLNNFRFALIQRRSFPLAPRYDEPVQHCVVPPGELPGLQWEPPGSRARLARIRSRASHRCHICIWAAVYASIGIYVGIPFGCLKLARGPWTLPFPKVHVNGVPLSPLSFSEVSPPPFNRRSGGWFE